MSNPGMSTLQNFKPVIFNVFHPVGMAPQGPSSVLEVPGGLLLCQLEGGLYDVTAVQ